MSMWGSRIPPIDALSHLHRPTGSAWFLCVAAVACLALVACGHTPDAPQSSHQCANAQGHHDGDTFTCVPADGQTASFVVRVASIDAPETGQAYWRMARGRLRELAVSGSSVDCYKVDRYERRVCRLRTKDEQDAADLMLSEGLAWYPEDFSAEDEPIDRERYRRLQSKGQAAKRGLWSQPDPMSPKECRQHRQAGLRCR